MLATIMETSDEWIRERSGVEARQYVDRGTSTLGALDSGGAPGDRIGRPDAGRHRHGRLRDDDARLLHAGERLPAADRTRPAERSRASTSASSAAGSCTGCSWPTRTSGRDWRGTSCWSGAEVHSAFMPFREASWARLAGAVDTPMPQDEWDFNTQNRHLAVLFGDGAAAVVVQAFDGEDRGVIDHLIGADGTDFTRLYIPSAGTRNRPYLDAATARAPRTVAADGRALRLQDGDHQDGRGDAADPRAQRRASRGPVARADAPGQPPHQRVRAEAARACPTARSSTTSRSTATRRRPPFRSCGTRPPARAASRPATSC